MAPSAHGEALRVGKLRIADCGLRIGRILLSAILGTIAIQGGEVPAIESLAVRGTLLTRGSGEAREMVLEVETKTGGEAGPGTLIASCEGTSIERAIERIEPGVHVHEVGIPVPATAVDAEFKLRAAGGERTARARIAPPRPFTIFLAPTSAEIERALEGCAATDGFPDDAKFRCTLQGALPVPSRLAAEKRKELIARIQEGRLEVCGLELDSLPAEPSGEELCRAMAPAGRLRRDLGIPIETASSTRAAGFPWALPAVLASAGLRHWSVASFEESAWPSIPPGESLFEWRSPGGVGVLVHLGKGPEGDTAGLGEGLAEARKKLPGRLAELAANGEARTEVLIPAPGAGPAVSRTAREWNERYSNPHVVVATLGQFFRRAAGGGKKVPVLAKPWMVPRPTAVKGKPEVIPAAESLASVAAVLDPAWPYPREAIEAAYASRSQEASESLVRAAFDALAARVAPAGSRVVVNPLAWTRDGAPEAKGWIPGLGYAVFRGEASDVPAVTVGEDSIESPFYRVRLNARRTAIAGIFDKRIGMELLDPASPLGAGEVLDTLDDASTARARQPEGRVVERSTVPGRGRLSFETRSASMGAVTVGIILYGDLLRLDLEVRVERDAGKSGEELRAAFPFAGAGAKVRCGLPGAAMNPDEDRPPGAAPGRIAIDRWVSMNSPRLGIAWSSPDAPLVELGRTGAGGPLLLSRITGARLPSGAPARFRYAIASAPEMSDLSAAQMAAEHSTPLLRVGPPGIGADPGRSESFLSLEDGSKGAMITTFKRAEDGDGFVVRILDYSSDTRQAVLRSAWPIESVQFADVLETPRAALAAAENTARVYLKGPGFTTLRLKFGK